MKQMSETYHLDGECYVLHFEIIFSVLLGTNKFLWLDYSEQEPNVLFLTI